MAQTVLVSMKRRLSWQARLHLPYYGAVACAIRERHMQCLMQVFDSDGKPQLRGGSNLKDHIDWLPLVGLTPDTGQSQNYGTDSGASRTSPAQDVKIVVRAGNPAMATLYGAASGQSNVNSWSKATLDCFTDGDDQSWSLRMNLGEPAVTGVQSLGGQIGNAATLLEVGLNFTKSSIDYRDPDTKVGYFMPSGALWDPEQQVCKSFDPDDPVSRLQD